jgi:hypothetical protein
VCEWNLSSGASVVGRPAGPADDASVLSAGRSFPLDGTFYPVGSQAWTMMIGVTEEVVVMAEAPVPTEDRFAAVRQNNQAGTRPFTRSEHSGTQHVSPFWRHFLQMLAVMAAGMIATGALFLTIVGVKTWDEVTTQYPTQALLAIAAGMTVPMVAWMVYRGMGWKHSAEMAAAMIVPVVPFLCLVWFDVTKSAQCGGYCLIAIAAMLGLMLYRRNEYSMQMTRR